MFRTELAIPYPNFPEGAFDSTLLCPARIKGDCAMIPSLCLTTAAIPAAIGRAPIGSIVCR